MSRETEEYLSFKIFRTRFYMVLDNLLVDDPTSTGGLDQMPDGLKKSLPPRHPLPRGCSPHLLTPGAKQLLPPGPTWLRQLCHTQQGLKQL